MRTLLAAIFFGLLCAVLWGAADFLSRKTSKSIDCYLMVGYIQLIGCLASVAVAFLLGGDLPVLKPNFVLLNVVVGLLALAGLVFLYRGLSQGTMSLVAPLSGGMGPAVAVVLSVIILGQVVASIHAYAIAGVIIGVVLSGVKFSELRTGLLPSDVSQIPSVHAKLCESNARGAASSEGIWGGRIMKGLDSAILSAVAAGAVYLGLGVLTPQFGWLFPTIIMKGTGALVVFGFMLVARGGFVIPNSRTMLRLILMGVLDVVGMLAFNFGILTAGGYLPIVVTFSGLSGLIVLMLARLFYREKLDIVQTAGIFLVITGAMTLLYFQ